MWITTRNTGFFLLVCLMLVFIPNRPVYAHYLWIMQEGDQYVVARGHIPDRLEAYHPERVTFVRALDGDGKEIPGERIDEGARVVFRAEEPPAIAMVMCDWGSRVNTTRGKKLMTRMEAEQQGFKVLEAFLSTQTSKTLFKDGEAVNRPLGLKFELVPMKSPFQMAPGEPMKIQLLFEGQPVQDAMVFSDEKMQIKTDENGMVLLEGHKKGWNVISARHRVLDTGNPDITYHQFMTFLVFKVP